MPIIKAGPPGISDHSNRKPQTLNFMPTQAPALASGTLSPCRANAGRVCGQICGCCGTFAGTLNQKPETPKPWRGREYKTHHLVSYMRGPTDF